MKALVLGATGHVGNAFVRELLLRGWQVTATSRQSRPSLNLVGLPVAFRSGDCDQPRQLDEWIQGHDLVVDAAAPYPWRIARDPAGPPREQLAEARTTAIVTSTTRHDATLAFVSSVSTLPRRDRALDAAQSALLRRVHPYFELKERMEARICEATRSGLRAVVVNPSVCLGPFDLKPRDLCIIPVMLENRIPAVAHHQLNVIDVRDVAAATLNAVEQQRFGRPIALAGHNTTAYGLAEAVCRIGGVEPPRTHVPAAIPAAAAFGNELLGSIGLGVLDYPSLGMLLMLDQCWMHEAAGRRALLPKLLPLSRTVAESIDWYRDIGHLDAQRTWVA